MLMTVLGIGVSCAHLFQLPPATSSPAYSARVLRGLFQNRRPSLETPHYCRMLDNQPSFAFVVKDVVLSCFFLN